MTTTASLAVSDRDTLSGPSEVLKVVRAPWAFRGDTDATQMAGRRSPHRQVRGAQTLCCPGLRNHGMDDVPGGEMTTRRHLATGSFDPLLRSLRTVAACQGTWTLRTASAGSRGSVIPQRIPSPTSATTNGHQVRVRGRARRRAGPGCPPAAASKWWHREAVATRASRRAHPPTPDCTISEWDRPLEAEHGPARPRYLVGLHDHQQFGPGSTSVEPFPSSDGANIREKEPDSPAARPTVEVRYYTCRVIGGSGARP